MNKINWFKILPYAVVLILFIAGLYYYSNYLIPNDDKDNSGDVLAKLQESGDLVFGFANILQVKLPESLSILVEAENAGEFASAAEIVGDALKVVDEMAASSAELKVKTEEFKTLAGSMSKTDAKTSALKTADVLDGISPAFENLVNLERELLGTAKDYYEKLASKEDPGTPDFLRINAKIAAASSNTADLIQKFVDASSELNASLKGEPAVAKNVAELKIEDVALGQSEEAKNGDTLIVHYIGTLQNGTKFDSSVDRGKPFTFVLGSGKVIKGWEQGLLGMKIGGHRRLTIPPELGYGSRGQGSIPPNSTLIFEIDLLDINPR